MRDLLAEFPDHQPQDSTEAARRNMRPALRRRFYKAVTVAEHEAGFGILLDDRSIRTPARRPLAVPVRQLAEALAAEWEAQAEFVDPAAMPLTRLANSIIDGVAQSPDEVSAEIRKYLASDLLFYRAEGPEALTARQSASWDAVLAWVHETFGARFMLAEGLMFVAQPEGALALVSQAIPGDAWRLGAAHAITTLTGSALLAIAVAQGTLTPDAAWDAAHVDEDWQMEYWGQDELAVRRRQFRWSEMQAAATVLAALR
jgi:chaperone required for assembly of F1-ATPase